MRHVNMVICGEVSIGQENRVSTRFYFLGAAKGGDLINYFPLILVMLAVIVLLLGILSGYFLRRYLAEAKIASAEEAATKIVEDAKKEVAGKKREAALEAKEEVHQLRAEAERENRDRRSEVQRLERRVQQKEELVDRKLEGLEKKEELLSRKEQEMAQGKVQLDELAQKQVAEMERVSGLSTEAARELLLNNVRDEVRHESALIIREAENQAREEAEKESAGDRHPGYPKMFGGYRCRDHRIRRATA